ncbi:MAG: transposase family protein, partial [Verrucomicrobiaceae bacterium]
MLTDMVVFALCAPIDGDKNWSDVERFIEMKRIWFSRFLEIPNGIPSHDTFVRLDPAEFYACLQRGVRTLNK